MDCTSALRELMATRFSRPLFQCTGVAGARCPSITAMSATKTTWAPWLPCRAALPSPLSK
eukprot:11536492-Alexandrium_andersonii.AAC.1